MAKPRSLSGIIKDNIIPNRFYLPWLSTIVEEDYTKCVICAASNEVACGNNVHNRNIPVEILAASL